MAAVEIPLIIMKIAATFTLVILFYFYRVMGKAPDFIELFNLIFNFSGMIYIAYGMSTNNIFMFRGGLLLVTVSYGIFVSYYLERMGERKTEKDEKKK